MLSNEINIELSRVAADILKTLITNDKLDKYDIEHVAACYGVLYAEVRMMDALSIKDLAVEYGKK